jgi:DNA-directed RNA polymerase specialized sigma24 family protein
MSGAPRSRASSRPASLRLPVVGERQLRRERLALALERCPRRDRLVLALMLVDRLSADEAADALGISVGRLQHAFEVTLEDLRRVLAGGPLRSRTRRALSADGRLRRAL